MKSMKKGFTLVELMVVIVIIGVLAALAIPRFLGASNKAKISEFKPVIKQIYTLEQAYRQERNAYTGDTSAIGFESPKGNNGKLPYFTYSLSADTSAAGSYTATATLRTAVGKVASGATVVQTVDSAGTAANTGETNLKALANWQ